jgi:hypothetical protein
MIEKPEKIETQVETEKRDSLNEYSGFYFSSAIKIHDPNTNEVLVQIRGDN